MHEAEEIPCLCPSILSFSGSAAYDLESDEAYVWFGKSGVTCLYMSWVMYDLQFTVGYIVGLILLFHYIQGFMMPFRGFPSLPPTLYYHHPPMNTTIAILTTIHIIYLPLPSATLSLILSSVTPLPTNSAGATFPFSWGTLPATLSSTDPTGSGFFFVGVSSIPCCLNDCFCHEICPPSASRCRAALVLAARMEERVSLQ